VVQVDPGEEWAVQGVGWFVAIIIGGLGGWIAGMVMNKHHNIFVNIIVGLVGALIAKWLLGLVGVNYSGWLPSLGVSIVGAALLLFVLGLFGRRSPAGR
jgi:uncharacterized membrane protein YeaQ/YmgE (transglycosylase-associated protein family)